MQSCFTSTETIKTIRDYTAREPRTAAFDFNTASALRGRQSEWPEPVLCLISMLLYVHEDRTDYYSIRDGEPKTATSVDFDTAPEFCASLKQIWCLTSTETIWLVRDGEKVGGGGVWRWVGSVA